MEPVAAYDRLASRFHRLSEARRDYLETVERVILGEMPAERRSLLDVGAGDGTRSARIAAACGIPRLVWLEPSFGMRSIASGGAETWAIRAEELVGVQDEFDVILCLWNVLGHIDSVENRQLVMREFARLLGPRGVVFVDVSHRYNARHYGWVQTVGRFLHDVMRPDVRNGDVMVNWASGCSYGHVFTDSEFRSLAAGAGLHIANRVVIDYASGRIRGSSLFGHLLYRLENVT